MSKRITHRVPARLTLALVAILGVLPAASGAQDRLRTMPGYEQYQKMSAQIQGAVRSGALQATWVENGKALEYTIDGKRYRYDVATRKAAELPALPPQTGGGRGGRGGVGGAPERGRQFAQAQSPDKAFEASYRDRNLWMKGPDGVETPITTDGSEKDRIKYGTASWVYGEELDQTTAIWWAPNSRKVAYYRFDEKPVPDYLLQLDQTKLYSTLDTEAYPKAGVDNPVVDIFVYDVATKRSVKLDVRTGKPFENSVVGHYVYNVRWTPDASELIFNRTNRRQNIMEFTACTPDTASCRVVIREEWPTGWVENNPTMVYLKDNKRFIWASERTGFNNYYLYDISGKLITALTNQPVEVAGIIRVDEDAGVLYYMARSGDNFMKTQLHRVGLDGRNDRRLTDPAFTHAVTLAPDGKHFVDVAQSHDAPPTTRLLDATGKVVAELAKSDMTKFEQLGLKKTEMFTYMAADGKTKLYGMISFPSTFDPAKKYPVLVPVYGGPASASNTARETFSVPSPTTEYGFIVVNLSSRATPGMGKRTLDALYEKLGQTEMDDMAEGIKALDSRPYIDAARVGIYGTSYGGYTSAMMLMRFPELVAAASASSPVTDWRHYDTIYTERYMWIPQENEEGYNAGSAMTYVPKLKGRLMLYYGTADNNVHPSNMMQLIQALQRAGKSFEVQVGPDQGHSGLNQARMMEFFIENLVMRPASVTTTF
jgi:dipeptidyl-peptidase-4